SEGFLSTCWTRKCAGTGFCPCGGGRIIRKCHWDAVGQLQKAPAGLLIHAVATIAKHLEAQRQSSAAGRRSRFYKVAAKPPSDVKLDDWYYGFDCLVCSHRFAVFDDKFSGKAQAWFLQDDHFRVACPHCSADRLNGTGLVRHFQAS